MIVGLELALALVPLVVVATEHYPKLHRKGKLIMSQAASDVLREEFLELLVIEIEMLGHSIRCLIEDLNDLTASQKTKLLSLDREQWRADETNFALIARLGEDTERAFTTVLNRLLKSLDALVSEKSLGLVDSDVTSTGVFKKLEVFRQDLNNGATPHDLRKRFRFTTHESRRKVHIGKIEKCNKKLEKLINRKATNTSNINSIQISAPSTKMPPNRSRRMSHDVHDRLARTWSCCCPLAHEARVGLLKCLISPEIEDSRVNLELLVSMTGEGNRKKIWYSSRIHMLSEKEDTRVDTVDGENAVDNSVVRFVRTQDSVRGAAVPQSPIQYVDTESMCTMIKEAYAHNKTLELCFDGQKLWKARPLQKQPTLDAENGITLKAIFHDSRRKLTLKESRTLAVVLAHAILHYCESPWVTDDWNKEHVNFFLTNNVPDLGRPYLSTHFPPTVINSPSMANNMYTHPNPALLALGILLVELHSGKSIEELEIELGYGDGSWVTAERELDRMKDNVYQGYTNAIQACLNIGYLGLCDHPSLNDDRFRKLVIEKIVGPLEAELQVGFNITPESLGVL